MVYAIVVWKHYDNKVQFIVFHAHQLCHLNINNDHSYDKTYKQIGKPLNKFKIFFANWFVVQYSYAIAPPPTVRLVREKIPLPRTNSWNHTLLGGLPFPSHPREPIHLFIFLALLIVSTCIKSARSRSFDELQNTNYIIYHIRETRKRIQRTNNSFAIFVQKHA